MFKICGDEAKSAELSIEGREEWGDVKVSFVFCLGWADGKVIGTFSEERITELEEALRCFATGGRRELNFINEDGNVDISLKLKPASGKVELVALAIPDMVGEDRVSFCFDGVLSLD